jgi:hypothetical protein
MLVALKKRLALIDEARKIEVAGKYSKLKVFDKKTEVEIWCKNWETIYANAIELGLPEVADEQLQYDFTTAISAVDELYATTQ